MKIPLNLKKNENGFSLVEILIVIAVVIVIGTAGFLAYKHSHKSTVATKSDSASKVVSVTKIPASKSANPSGSATTQTNSSQSNNNLTTGPDPKKSLTDASGGYLVISEWGVKIPETDGLTFDYYPVADTGTGSNTYASLSSTQLDQSDPNCLSNSQTGGGSGGVLQRYAPSQQVYDEGGDSTGQASQVFASQTQIGGYYYEFEQPQETCQQNSSDNASIYSNTVSALKSGVANIQLVN